MKQKIKQKKHTMLSNGSIVVTEPKKNNQIVVPKKKIKNVISQREKEIIKKCSYERLAKAKEKRQRRAEKRIKNYEKKECRNCFYARKATKVKTDQGCYCTKTQKYHGLNAVCKKFEYPPKPVE